MVIYKAKDYQDMSRKAANIISAQIIMKPNCVQIFHEHQSFRSCKYR